MNRTGIIALLLGLVTLLTFSPVVDHDFVQWDDNLNITGNPQITKIDAEGFKWMFTDTALMRRYVPLAWLNWAGIHHFFGLNPKAFHGEALLLHVANAVLVFLLLRRVLRGMMPVPDEGRALSMDVTASLAALLWAIHPLRVEAVAWANCVLYPQSLFFALLSLLSYFRAMERSHRKTVFRVPLFWVSVGLFAASLLTYPTAFAFVVVLLIVDVGLLRRGSRDDGPEAGPHRTRWVQLLMEKAPFIIVTAVVAAVTLWARANMDGIWAGTSRVEELGWFDRVAQAFYIWAYFAWKPWWPTNLSPVYTQLVSFKAASLPFLFSMAGVVGVTLACIVVRKRRPLFLALWLCHLALLVPMLGLTEHPHYPNDRYSYLAGVTWSAMIAVALFKLAHARLRFNTAVALSLALAVVLGVSAFRQTFLWSNSEALFKGTIARLGADPYRCDLLWRLGLFYAQQRKTAEALNSFEQAFKISSGAPRIGNDLCALLVQEGRVDEALSRYEEILRSYPAHAMTHRNLATVLAGRGDLDRANTHFETAIQSDPKDVATRIQYASLLMRAGRAATASEQVRRALELNPDSAEANLFAGNLCMAEQDRDNALSHFRKAVALKSDYAEAHQNLGTLLAMSGNISAALPHFMQVAKLKPDLAEGHLACGMALVQLGRVEEAKGSYQNALKVAAAAGRADLVSQIRAQMPSP